MKLPFVKRSSYEALEGRVEELTGGINFLKGEISIYRQSGVLTLPQFRSAMVEVHDQDSAFKEALCKQINDTIDPFGNYSSALQRIFNELEDIKSSQCSSAQAIADAVLAVVMTRLGAKAEKTPSGLVRTPKKSSAPKRSKDGKFKKVKKNA
jgi:hypothetical protein